MPNDKTYRDKVVRITELVDVKGLLDSFTFVNCEINGPAVIIPTACRFTNNDPGAPADILLWEIPSVDDRVQKVGAIVARGCAFEQCRFRNVGLAGPNSFVQEFRRSMSE